MKNIIGKIHDTRELTQAQLDKAMTAIKDMLQLDTVDVEKENSEFYIVTTDDETIVDFKIDNYNNDKVSLVKYRANDDDMKRDDYGATLTHSEIRSKE
jgi:1,2-phenylacetyl-CoA epoxidase catalytic subunit